MQAVQPPLSEDRDVRWHGVLRWQEYDGERRANLLRMLGIGAFYAIELINRHGLRLGFIELPRVEEVDDTFHRAVTALVVAWTMACLGVLLAMRGRVFPAWLKFASTAADLGLLTAVLVVADGPRSPLVVVYFLLIALAGLRFSAPLVWFATIGSLVCYAVLNGYARWFTDRPIGVPRYHQLIFLLALVLAGIVLRQILRRTESAARELAARIRSSEPTQP